MRPGAPRTAVEPSAVPRAVAPTVTVEDAQDGWPIDCDRWRTMAAAVLTDLAVPVDAEVSLSFVAPAAMAELNTAYMGQPGPTDVLAFPIDADDHLRGGPSSTAAIPADRPPPMLGDIMICPEVAAANALDHAGSYDDELALLVVHGLLHLLGMDHADDGDRMAMQARERELLERHHGPLTRDPWPA